jgi:nucleoid DNA-binding protein
VFVDAILNAQRARILEYVVEKVKIRNFGSFAVRTKRERRGRSPTTGADIVIPAHRVLTFKPGPAMKKTVNNMPTS